MHSRRSTRAARSTATTPSSRRERTTRGAKNRSRRGADPHVERIRASTESGPVRKWVKVMRPPAPHIRFRVEKWVLVTDLTEEERKQMSTTSNKDDNLRADNTMQDGNPVHGAESKKTGNEQDFVVKESSE